MPSAFCISTTFFLPFISFQFKFDNFMLANYIPIGIMILFGIIFAVVMAKASEWFGPKNPTEQKLSTYESGMEPVRTARERVSVKYYLVAMMFIIFDIEVVFLYPWAVNFKALGMFGLIEMFVFIAILMFGYLYVWKKGALQWD
jgi:NADH-quinone oxidoreductase subunit A